MRQSKLLHFAQYITPAERAAFHKFLAAGYFKVPTEVRDLWAVVDAELLTQPEVDLDEASCFALVFPGKPYNQNKFRKLKTALLDQLMAFWEWESYRKSGVDRALNRLNHLNRLGEDRFFPQHYRHAEKTWESQADTIESLLHRHQMLLALSRYKFRQPQRQPLDTWAAAQESLRDFAASEAVRIAYLARNQQRITGQEMAPMITDQDLAYLEKRLPELPAEAQGYFLLYQSIHQADQTHWYPMLKKLLEFEQLPPEWAEDLMTGALNYCMAVFNGGNKAFLHEILEWYQRSLVEGVLVHNGKVLPAHLKNAVSVACKLGQMDWAQEMLERFTHQMTGNNQANAVDYNEGVIAFYRGEYKMALHKFYQVLQDFEDEYYGLDARIFMLQAYHLERDHSALDALVSAFRMYVRRAKTLNKARRQRYTLFLRFFRRVYQLPDYADSRRQRLQNDILAAPNFPSRDWLLEQLEDGSSK